VRIDWDEAVRPLLTYLRDQSSTVYIEIIQEFGIPTEAQQYDALLVMEEIISSMIAVCEQNLVAADIQIDQAMVRGKTIAFTTAMAEIKAMTGEDCCAALLITTASPSTGGAGRQRTDKKNDTMNGGRTAKALALTTPEDALTYALSDKCPNSARHNIIEKFQPTKASRWVCQHRGCNEPVADDMRTAYQRLRVTDAVENYWKGALCPTHFVHHLIGDLPGKAPDETIKQMAKASIVKKVRILTDDQTALYKRLKASSNRDGTNGTNMAAPAPSAAAPANSGGLDTDAAARYERFQQFERFEKQQASSMHIGMIQNKIDEPAPKQMDDMAMLRSPEFQQFRSRSQLAAQVKAAASQHLNC
jgi:hypothetical protein